MALQGASSSAPEDLSGFDARVSRLLKAVQHFRPPLRGYRARARVHRKLSVHCAHEVKDYIVERRLHLKEDLDHQATGCLDPATCTCCGGSFWPSWH